MVKKKYEDCVVDVEDNVATVSFNDNEQSLRTIKNIIFFEFSVKPGDIVDEGDKLLLVEAMKGTAELKSRVKGVVSEVNQEIEDEPELLKDKPTVWLLKISMK